MLGCIYPGEACVRRVSGAREGLLMEGVSRFSLLVRHVEKFPGWRLEWARSDCSISLWPPNLRGLNNLQLMVGLVWEKSGIYFCLSF